MDPKYLNLYKRKKKYQKFLLQYPIRSKKTERQKNEIVADIINQMKVRGFVKLNGDIAVDIHVATGDKKSPSIEKYAKNIIDLLHKTDGLDTEQNYLPFFDDKQIKYLHIKYSYTTGSDQTIITIKPFTSFIANVHFCYEHQLLEEETENENAIEEYRNLVEKRNLYTRKLSVEAYESMRKMSLADVQKITSQFTAISPFFLRILFPRRTPLPIRSYQTDLANFFLKVPIRIDINDDYFDSLSKKGFSIRSLVRDKIDEYIASRDRFRDLQCPIILSVIYQPPYRRTPKDIDNILFEYVFSEMNKSLNPPASLFRIEEYEFQDRVRTPPLAKDKRGTAVGFEVLKLNRNKNIRGSVIYLGFKADLYGNSIMEAVDSAIEKYLSDSV